MLQILRFLTWVYGKEGWARKEGRNMQPRPRCEGEEEGSWCGVKVTGGQCSLAFLPFFFLYFFLFYCSSALKLLNIRGEQACACLSLDWFCLCFFFIWIQMLEKAPLSLVPFQCFCFALPLRRVSAHHQSS